MLDTPYKAKQKVEERDVKSGIIQAFANSLIYKGLYFQEDINYLFLQSKAKVGILHGAFFWEI